MKKLYYDIKISSANTTYVTMDSKDQNEIEGMILTITSYMNELCLSKNKDIRDFTNWYKRPNKKYYYNKKMSRYNSPQSYLGGIINNLHYGNQHNFSLIQLETIQDIINLMVDIIHQVEKTYNLELQVNQNIEKIFIQENLFNNNQD